MCNKLSDIFEKQKYNTDKYDLGYIDNFYDNFLIKFKDTPINLMEIGACRGESIKLWKDYLHQDSNIFATDINYFSPINGTTTVIGDMYSYDQVLKFSDEYFDIIIDDGPHSFESFVLLIQRYYSKIKQNGSLVIEDVICSSWIEPLINLIKMVGYSKCEVIHMGGKQKTEELFNLWKNGLYILSITK